MNKFLNYAILIYTIFSGIVATLFAIGYFVIAPSTTSSAGAITLTGIDTLQQIVSANLTPYEQSNYISMLQDFYAMGESAEQTSLTSLPLSQFMEYESIFIVPSAILLLVMAYTSKNNKKDE